MKHEFEAEQIKVFAEMADKGYIYRGLKPVFWCPECKTALAEAEIEYAEDPCHSIYVKFNVTDDLGKFAAMGIDPSKVFFVIWTTTTWTLPANVAICVGPRYEYSVIKSGDEYYVMATDLYQNAMEEAGITDYEVVATIKGSELEYMKTQHPFLDRESLLIVGDHVTLESGTGCVHTAPGHGVDDYNVCRNYPEIPVICPVNGDGVLTEEAGEFAGLTTEEANKKRDEYEDKMVHAEEEISAMKAEAGAKTAEERSRLLEQTKAEAANILENAKKRGEMEHDKIVAEAQKEIADIVTTATEKIVLSADVAKSYEEFLKSVEGNAKNE